MKNRYLFTLLLVLTVMGLSLPSRAQSKKNNKQLITTLQEGENLVPGQYCIQLSPSETSVIFATEKEKQFYLYDNEKRTGPFKEVTSEEIKNCITGTEPQCARFTSAECFMEDVFNKYVSYGDGGQSITIKGKKYGPYMTIMQFLITCDEKNFAALILSEDSKVQLIHSGGRSVKLKGTPLWIQLSPDGTQALAAYNPALDPDNFDPNHIDMEAINRFEVVDLTGKIFGPYDMAQHPAENFWFCKTAGSHWFMKQESDLYCDGKLLKGALTDINPCDLWINENLSSLARVLYGEPGIPETADFLIISNPLQIITFKEEGKTYLKWITLEDGKQLVVYTAAF